MQRLRIDLSRVPEKRRGVTVVSGDAGSAACLAELSDMYYTEAMKTLTVRLPEPLVADIEAESRGRKISKSDVVRERLERARRKRRRTTSLNAIADLIGSVDGLPADLAARKKEYLQRAGYGQKRPR